MSREILEQEGRLWFTWATYDDAKTISRHLRLNDQKECMIHRTSPYDALTSGFDIEGARNYSIFLDKTCIAMCGTVPIDYEFGRVWFLGTSHINKNFRPFLRGCARVIKHLQGDYKQIENLCPVDHHETIMWLTWCGFTFDDYPYEVNGHTMMRFVRCVKKKNNVISLKRPVLQ
mgnify:FL=1